VRAVGKERNNLASEKAEVVKRLNHEEAAVERVRAKIHEVRVPCRWACMSI
jgi:hypothetical protein